MLTGDVEVVLALAVGELVVQLAGLGVDEVRRERAGVAPEQRVGQRAVPPEEAGEVQPDEQQRQRVEQPRRGVRPQGLREQRAVGQRELQVLGDQRRLELLAVRRLAPGDDADRLDARDVEAVEPAEQAVLALGQPARRPP